ncbi:type II toxin-antitoxin system RelE/ParE family toxin [Pinirhizobacter sp.]|jgi:phage-related protein|uniref:type II toxin-antitoxin system RelE/ParE family toxin n=1 Tax=Pinirhizobacter sp. TaxID=2950432 RepID=UPI002F42815B
MRKLVWLGTADKDLKAMPERVRSTFGYALYEAQLGNRHNKAKVLTGFGSAGVLEVVEDSQSATFRAVYTVKFGATVYVLHCFQKKSMHGIATPRRDVDLIRERLKEAQALALGETK